MTALRSSHELRPATAVRRGQKKGRQAEARRPKGDVMLNIMEPVMQGNASECAQPRIRLFGTINMTPAQWAQVSENPRQRDTEARARTASHLKEPHPAHVKVNAAQTPDGRMFKLDGHTRSFLWQSGEVEAPERLFVDVWTCADIEAVKELYSTFDNAKAAERSADQVHGAMREIGVMFQSAALRHKRFSGACRAAYSFMFSERAARDVNVYDLVKYWERELVLLDECDPSPHFYHAGLIAAALLTFRRYGARATPFWKAFSENAGVKVNGGMDAVQALHERSARMRAEGRVSSRAHIETIIATSLSAFDSYRTGYTYSTSSGIKAYRDNSLTRWSTAAKSAPRWG